VKDVKTLKQKELGRPDSTPRRDRISQMPLPAEGEILQAGGGRNRPSRSKGGGVCSAVFFFPFPFFAENKKTPTPPTPWPDPLVYSDSNESFQSYEISSTKT